MTVWGKELISFVFIFNLGGNPRSNRKRNEKIDGKGELFWHVGKQSSILPELYETLQIL